MDLKFTITLGQETVDHIVHLPLRKGDGKWVTLAGEPISRDTASVVISKAIWTAFPESLAEELGEALCD